MQSIPLTKNNLHNISIVTGIDSDILDNKIMLSLEEQQKKSNIQRFLDFVNQDTTWYIEAVKKINSIKETLPRDISHQERTIRTFGWIVDLLPPHRNSQIPFVKDAQYSKAWSVELMFENPDSYEKMLRWD